MAIFTQGKFQASLSENLKLIISHKSVKLICIILFVKLKYPLSLDVSNMNKESIVKLLITTRAETAQTMANSEVHEKSSKNHKKSHEKVMKKS